MARSKMIPLVSPACPYCGVVQHPPPQRRKKCRDCGQVIHVVKEGEYKQLVTEKESSRRIRAANEQRWKELSKQLSVALQEGDWGTARMAYLGQADILFHEGRNHHVTAQEAERCALRCMQEAGIKEVQISTCSDERVCPYCRALEGRILSVEDALEQMPLPGPRCEDGSDVNPHGGRCRCVYLAVIPKKRKKSASTRATTKKPDQSAQGCLSLVVIVFLVSMIVAC